MPHGGATAHSSNPSVRGDFALASAGQWRGGSAVTFSIILTGRSIRADWWRQSFGKRELQKLQPLRCTSLAGRRIDAMKGTVRSESFLKVCFAKGTLANPLESTHVLAEMPLLWHPEAMSKQIRLRDVLRRCDEVQELWRRPLQGFALCIPGRLDLVFGGWTTHFLKQLAT